MTHDADTGKGTANFKQNLLSLRYDWSNCWVNECYVLLAQAKKPQLDLESSEQQPHRSMAACKNPAIPD